jgi:hypothetical protein
MSRVLSSALRGVRVGFVVVSPFLTACKFLRLLGAEAEAHTGYGAVPDHIHLCIHSAILFVLELLCLNFPSRQ